ncbi:neuropeptide FF receptor 2-like [Schistocerca nitens]|uniref:neuropeptide FF receptor 2-like n=1 Tax=Schistocerca nitens TaxID=7011 RepID=UPI00211866DD|nr:neuropeptide FF receptor 2-like [Schistocerca nitens]
MTENETGYYSQWESTLNESNTSEAITSSPLYLAWWTLSSSSNVTATTLVVNASTPDFSLDEDGNATEGQNCTNDYCIPDIDYWNMVYQHVYPKDYEWILIAMHSLVFVAGLVGNALVCLAVYRNHAMRTVTNYFIVNLAVADFMVILFCLPPTVLWDVTETWFMGTGLCKVVLYLQVRRSFSCSSISTSSTPTSV